jgi:ATP synthase protein I
MAVENHFSAVRKVLYAQTLVTVLVATVFLYLGGWKYAVSPLTGSLIALLPNLFFAYKVYLTRNSDAHSMLQAFYAGETIKLIITAAFFAIVLQNKFIEFSTLLVGYISVLSVFWFALYYLRS